MMIMMMTMCTGRWQVVNIMIHTVVIEPYLQRWSRKPGGDTHRRRSQVRCTGGIGDKSWNYGLPRWDGKNWKKLETWQLYWLTISLKGWGRTWYGKLCFQPRWGGSRQKELSLSLCSRSLSPGWEFKATWSWDLITLLNNELKTHLQHKIYVLRIGEIIKKPSRNFTHYWPGLKVTQSLLIIVWSMSSTSPFRGQSCDFRSFSIHDVILGMRLSPVVLRYRDIVQINTQILKLKSFFSFKAENRKRSVLGKCIW